MPPAVGHRRRGPGGAAGHGGPAIVRVQGRRWFRHQLALAGVEDSSGQRVHEPEGIEGVAWEAYLLDQLAEM